MNQELKAKLLEAQKEIRSLRTKLERRDKRIAKLEGEYQTAYTAGRNASRCPRDNY